MKRRDWKRLHPNNAQEAIRYCLDYAEAKHNRSVARIGDLIGTTEWNIYKWLSEGSMPSKWIRPFEFACGATYYTQYLVNSTGDHVMIHIPTGRSAEASDIPDLQIMSGKAINVLAEFYSQKANAGETVAALTALLTNVALHRNNVQKSAAPELPLFREDGE